MQVEVGHWYNCRPRCQRLCGRCATPPSERHLVLVFECPASEALRIASHTLSSKGILRYFVLGSASSAGFGHEMLHESAVSAVFKGGAYAPIDTPI